MFVNLQWISRPIKPITSKTKEQSQAHFAQLTATLGSLGLFETLAIRLANMQRTVRPTIDPARAVIFAADHGIASPEICGEAPPTTRSMVDACLQGISPIARMAQQLDLDIELIDVGMIPPTQTVPKSYNKRVCWFEQAVAAGSADFQQGPAMSHEQFSQALRVGRDAVKRAIKDKKRLFIGGEMGIGGSVSASAIVCSVLKVLPEFLTAPGKGSFPMEGFARRTEVIQRGLDIHEPFHETAMESLRRLGGFEIAALTGAFITCGQQGIPAVVDGFVASTAALVAISLHPPLKNWLIFAHRSAEPGQLRILQTLNIQPVLDLNMRHGEATGAAAILPLLRLACHFLEDAH